MSTQNKVYMGVDVSKETLDIFFNDRSYTIKNDETAISAFIKAEIAGAAIDLCVLESTGGYERGVIQGLQRAGIPAHCGHPSKIHAFAKACGHFAKTDKLDAILLWKYARFIADKEKGDRVLDESQQQLIALRRLARNLEDSLHSAQCRSKQMPDICGKYIEEEIKLYQEQLKKIYEEMDQVIGHHSGLKQKRDILMTMKGVGPKISAILLAEMPEIGTLSRTEVASLIGVAPKTHQSGKRTGPGRISGGRFYARKALYMAALVATRYLASMKQKYAALLSKGKAKKVAIVAMMREIIIILNSMVKNMTPYRI